MKKLIILLIYVVSFSCKAQQTIPMSLDYSNSLKNNNYIKDTNGDLDKFIGTWKWIHPSTPNLFSNLQVKTLNEMTQNVQNTNCN